MRELFLCLILLLSFQVLSQENVRKKMEEIQVILEEKDATVHNSSEEKLKLIFDLTKIKFAPSNSRYRDLERDPYLDKIRSITYNMDSTSLLSPTEKIEKIQKIYDDYRVIDPTEEERKAKRVPFVNINAFKLDVLRPFVYGESSIFYERSFKGSYSLEIGIGLIQGEPIFDFSSKSTNKNLASKNMGTGFTTSIGFRAYLQKDKKGLNGFYLGPSFIFRHNRYDYSGPSNTAKGHDNISSLSLDVGYQLWFVRRFGMNFYIGPGISCNGNKDYYTIPIYNGTDSDPTLEYHSIYSTKFSFYLNLGVKLDIGW